VLNERLSLSRFDPRLISLPSSLPLSLHIPFPRLIAPRCHPLPPPPPQLSALTALGITHGQAAADTRMVGQLEGMRARADACSEAVSLVYMAPGR
jgi:hypothetical protein